MQKYSFNETLDFCSKCWIKAFKVDEVLLELGNGSNMKNVLLLCPLFRKQDHSQACHNTPFNCWKLISILNT